MGVAGMGGGRRLHSIRLKSRRPTTTPKK
jgi:hypothetical protein